MGERIELSAAEMEARMRAAAASKARVQVSWKDEGGSKGQIWVVDLDKEAEWEAAEIARTGSKPFGIPYFGPRPDFILAQFWGSTKRARDLAKAFGVALKVS